MPAGRRTEAPQSRQARMAAQRPYRFSSRQVAFVPPSNTGTTWAYTPRPTVGSAQTRPTILRCLPVHRTSRLMPRPSRDTLVVLPQATNAPNVGQSPPPFGSRAFLPDTVRQPSRQGSQWSLKRLILANQESFCGLFKKARRDSADGADVPAQQLLPVPQILLATDMHAQIDDPLLAIRSLVHDLSEPMHTEGLQGILRRAAKNKRYWQKYQAPLAAMAADILEYANEVDARLHDIQHVWTHEDEQRRNSATDMELERDDAILRDLEAQREQLQGRAVEVLSQMLMVIGQAAAGASAHHIRRKRNFCPNDISVCPRRRMVEVIVNPGPPPPPETIPECCGAPLAWLGERGQGYIETSDHPLHPRTQLRARVPQTRENVASIVVSTATISSSEVASPSMSGVAPPSLDEAASLALDEVTPLPLDEIPPLSLNKVPPLSLDEVALPSSDSDPRAVQPPPQHATAGPANGSWDTGFASHGWNMLTRLKKTIWDVAEVALDVDL
ncbi:hypothetical protein FISHEDRAFT_72397 [Fistulina hepatica ATCC 64428]|uniref:Uncharacterized protein n=1 Tax=Fistulina hepatica ATCC 64428 TaxID=1128425 RepID=A0A0D7AHH8_9AGAR|nr:hypothetical protein FISHEDRAFT_72397 [Fistulina hepatica ATCC 64428]